MLGFTCDRNNIIFRGCSFNGRQPFPQLHSTANRDWSVLLRGMLADREVLRDPQLSMKLYEMLLAPTYLFIYSSLQYTAARWLWQRSSRGRSWSKGNFDELRQYLGERVAALTKQNNNAACRHNHSIPSWSLPHSMTCTDLSQPGLLFNEIKCVR